MIETEYKFLLPESEFREALNKAVSGFIGEADSYSEVLQVNYYYDTPDFRCSAEGITVRVRLKEYGMKGYIKRHDKGVSGRSVEEYFTVDELPGTVYFEGKELKLLGNLTTLRKMYVFPGVELCFDTSYYLGKVDYEVEIEYTEDGVKLADELVGKFGFCSGIKGKGKMSRFLTQYSKYDKIEKTI